MLFLDAINLHVTSGPTLLDQRGNWLKGGVKSMTEGRKESVIVIIQ